MKMMMVMKRTRIKPKRKTRLPSNWRDRIEIIRHREEYGLIEFTVSFKKGFTPKGFHTNIGFLIVDKDGNSGESHIYDEHLRKRGIGTMLYTNALDHLGSLTTDYHAASDSAQGLWRALIRHRRYKTNFFGKKLTVWK